MRGLTLTQFLMSQIWRKWLSPVGSAHNRTCRQMSGLETRLRCGGWRFLTFYFLSLSSAGSFNARVFGYHTLQCTFTFGNVIFIFRPSTFGRHNHMRFFFFRYNENGFNCLVPKWQLLKLWIYLLQVWIASRLIVTLRGVMHHEMSSPPSAANRQLSWGQKCLRRSKALRAPKAPARRLFPPVFHLKQPDTEGPEPWCE